MSEIYGTAPLATASPEKPTDYFLSEVYNTAPPVPSKETIAPVVLEVIEDVLGVEVKDVVKISSTEFDLITS
jgi:hypothetical protein